MSPKRILVIQLRQLGDILLTTPCVREIKAFYPDAEISFLSHKMGKMILDGNPYIHQNFYYHENDSILEQLKLIKTLREISFDLAFDFMNNPRSSLFCLFSGAKKRVSFKTSRSWAYTHSVKNEMRGEYIVQEKFQLLASEGISSQSVRLTLPWGEQHLEPIKGFIKEQPGFAESKIRVVLSPTHRREVRKWPLERYAKLADRLVKEWGASVCWIWGPGEEALVDSCLEMCQESTLKAPSTSFRELAAFVGNVDLFIGNSNGPSHVAVSADICTYQLHGHTNLRSWCPLSEKHIGIQSSEFGKDGATLNSITLDNVWNDLQKFKPVVETYAELRMKKRLIKNYPSGC